MVKPKDGWGLRGARYTRKMMGPKLPKNPVEAGRVPAKQKKARAAAKRAKKARRKNR